MALCPRIQTLDRIWRSFVFPKIPLQERRVASKTCVSRAADRSSHSDQRSSKHKKISVTSRIRFDSFHPNINAHRELRRITHSRLESNSVSDVSDGLRNVLITIWRTGSQNNAIECVEAPWRSHAVAGGGEVCQGIFLGSVLPRVLPR